jgi:hypothetical protein
MLNPNGLNCSLARCTQSRLTRVTREASSCKHNTEAMVGTNQSRKGPSITKCDKNIAAMNSFAPYSAAGCRCESLAFSRYDVLCCSPIDIFRGWRLLFALRLIADQDKLHVHAPTRVPCSSTAEEVQLDCKYQIRLIIECCPGVFGSSRGND